MEQSPPSNRAILDWLADYTHFICDQFDLPHERAKGLLQQYLHLTTLAPPQHSATSPYEQPTSYPALPNPQQSTLSGEQLPSSHLATHLQHTPPSHSAPPSPHPESCNGEEADHASNSVAVTTPKAVPQEPSSPYGQQLENMNVDSGFPQRGAASLQSTEPAIETPIGSIKDYDPLWVQHNNVDSTTAENLQSSMRFDTLFSKGVIKIGDVLTFQILYHDNGQDRKTEAHLQITGSSKTHSRVYPDVSVTLLSDPSRQYPILKTCQGTRAMIGHIQDTCNVIVLKPTWQDIQVFRGQQALGSLWWVKQAFHLWRDRKDQEAQATGQFFRNRRPRRDKGASDVVVHRNGRFGVFQDGIFVQDLDQARFRSAR